MLATGSGSCVPGVLSPSSPLHGNGFHLLSKVGFGNRHCWYGDYDSRPLLFCYHNKVASLLLAAQLRTSIAVATHLRILRAGARAAFPSRTAATLGVSDGN